MRKGHPAVPQQLVGDRLPLSILQIEPEKALFGSARLKFDPELAAGRQRIRDLDMGMPVVVLDLCLRLE